MMIKLLTILFCIISLSLNATTYYVATTGSDAAAGSIAAPWATWQKAFDAAEANDTVYFRGGTWYIGAGEKVVHDPINSGGYGVHGTNGTYGNWIVFMNYPGEVPVLDATSTTSFEEMFEIRSSTYVKVKGLTFQGKAQASWNQIIRQAVFYENGTIYLENLTSRNSSGYGFTINGYDTVHVINCDSYTHFNPLSDDPGNKPDGFAISSGGGFNANNEADYTYIYGCRAWNCSDDGMEVSTEREYHVYNNWVFANGWANGVGVGIKYGPGNEVIPKEKRITKNCIATYNRGQSYGAQNLDSLSGPVGIFYNNLSYKDGTGFGDSWDGFSCENGIADALYRNNLVYDWTGDARYAGSLPACFYLYPSYANLAYNTFVLHAPAENDPKLYPNPAFTITDDDFIALPTDSTDCVSILSASRQADGSLPDIGNYFRLAVGSNLIAAGTNVGMSAVPDIGIDWAYLIPRRKLSPSKNGVWTISKRGNILLSR